MRHLLAGLTALSLVVLAAPTHANPQIDNGLSADFNGDTNVDRLDLLQWADQYGPNSGGDADGNGVSDGGDFLAWQRQIGAAAPEPPHAELEHNPEPTAIVVWSVLGAATGLGVVARRRGQRRIAGGR